MVRSRNLRRIRRGPTALASLAAAALAILPAASGASEPARVEAEAAARPGPSGPDFARGLAGMGEWLALPDAGRVWRPKGTGEGWRPYFHGQWSWTEHGWFWISADPWGHLTDHYGRWFFHPARGWMWKPGRVWAPAWVAWRWNAEVVGWAPLAPGGPAHASFWTFVPAARFVGEEVEKIAYPAPRVPALLLGTRPAVADPGPAAKRRPTRYGARKGGQGREGA
jgi:hypothetical protein